MLLGLDCGSTAIRAVLFDTDGGTAATTGTRRTEPLQPAPDHVEHDMDRFWQLAGEAIPEALLEAPQKAGGRGHRQHWSWARHQWLSEGASPAAGRAGARSDQDQERPQEIRQHVAGSDPGTRQASLGAGSCGEQAWTPISTPGRTPNPIGDRWLTSCGASRRLQADSVADFGRPARWRSRGGCRRQRAGRGAKGARSQVERAGGCGLPARTCRRHRVRGDG